MEIKHLKTALWLFGVPIILLIIFLPGHTKLEDLKYRAEQIEEKIKKTRLENKVLRQQHSLIQNDPLYQERVAREKMGLVRKGEVVFKIEEE